MMINEGVLEYFFNCPYCFEEISMLVDTSISAQEYIEDCEVCCNPILLTVESRYGAIQRLEAERAQ